MLPQWTIAPSCSGRLWNLPPQGYPEAGDVKGALRCGGRFSGDTREDSVPTVRLSPVVSVRLPIAVSSGYRLRPAASLLGCGLRRVKTVLERQFWLARQRFGLLGRIQRRSI